MQEWKNVKDYGRLWVSEIFNSAFKRVIGEQIRARNMKNMIWEGS